MKEFNSNDYEEFIKIVVIGVGGAGNNAVSSMAKNDKIQGADFWICNTDAQTLARAPLYNKFILGGDSLKGLGAGGDPEQGRLAAEESSNEIEELVTGANIVFIVAGMGGGTGTGASPVIARIAKEKGALTIAIAIRPFLYEGNDRRLLAIDGIEKLAKEVDAINVVSNDKLMNLNSNELMNDTYARMNAVISDSVQTIVDIINKTGEINKDFNDINNLLKNKGFVLIGCSEATGANKATEAADKAISNPLTEISIKGATNALINIIHSPDTTNNEIGSIANYIAQKTHNQLNISLGVINDPTLENTIKVSVIAVGFDDKSYLDKEKNKTFEGNMIAEEVKVEEEVVNDTSNVDIEDPVPDFMRDLDDEGEE